LVAAAILASLLVGCGPSDRATSASPAVSHAAPLPLSPSGTPAAPKQAAATWVSFTDVTATSGVDFVHATGTSSEKPFPAANGSGIASLDFDLDGRQDLYFATSTPFPIDPESGPSNRLYRNLGAWRFSASAAAGLDCGGYNVGLAVGDYDDDGFPDVYVSCYGENRLFRNEGDGTFSETAEARDPRWAVGAAFFDADGDGLLDLYVCNYGKWTLETNKFCGDAARGIRIYCTPRSVEPEDHVFYRSTGDGRFEDATSAAGFAVPPGRGQGLVAADINGDSKTDLYVGNDQNPNFLFLANGDGTFRNETEQSGAAYDYRGEMQSGMGVDVADADGDGLLDLFVTNYENEPNTLYRQSANGFFNDVSRTTGLAAPSVPWVGWGTAFADFDFDGRQDLVVTNGHTDDNLHELGRDGVFEQPPLLFRNAGGRFEEVGAGAGDYFRGRHPGRALVVADLDDDLDQDLVVGHQDAPPALLRGDGPAGDPPRVRIRLVGTRSNRNGVGAVLSATMDGVRQTIPVRGGGSYLSASDPRLLIAAPDGRVDLTVRWPWSEGSGASTLEAGGDYLIIEPKSPNDPARILRLASPSSSY
jgi:hypothetical protein